MTLAPDASPRGVEASLEASSVVVEAGRSTTVVIRVHNAAPVIDRVRAEVVGLDGVRVSGAPDALTLFPDASDQLRLRLAVPPECSAGRRRFAVEVRSEHAGRAPILLEADLVVERHAELRVEARPRFVSGRRSATVAIVCENPGDTVAPISMRAVDPENPEDLEIPRAGALTLELEASDFELGPAAERSVPLRISAASRRRRGTVTRPIVVTVATPTTTTATKLAFQHQPMRIWPIVLAALVVLALASVAVGLV